MTWCKTCTEQQMFKPIKASFNYPNEKKSLYCKKHAFTDMINVSEKKCIDCKVTRPNFNYQGKKAAYCYKCSKNYNGMVNVNGIRCQCGKRPSFNLPGLVAQYCIECAVAGMVNTNNKKCKVYECDKAPYYNFAGEIGGLYCATHSRKGMIDVITTKNMVLQK